MRAQDLFDEAQARLDVTCTTYMVDGERVVRAEDADGRVVGIAAFEPHGSKHLMGDDLWVRKSVRKRGVATAMYAFLDAQGYTVEPSDKLTVDGGAFWTKKRGLRQSDADSRRVASGAHPLDAILGEESQPVREGFSPPVKWRWVAQKSFEHEAQFKIGKVSYTVSLFQQNSVTDTWELDFTAAKGKTEFGYERSGTGNAFTVFGTVIDIARSFIGNRPPKAIEINNADRTRLRVNLRIAAAIAAGLGYSVATDEDDAILISAPG